jgi:hypothetical protein
LIEKLQPIDKRLRYQIDKLLRIANETMLSDKSTAAAADPLQFRPNPKSLLAAQDSDDEELEEVDSSNKLYKAPKNVPMHYDGLDSMCSLQRSHLDTNPTITRASD